MKIKPIDLFERFLVRFDHDVQVNSEKQRQYERGYPWDQLGHAKCKKCLSQFQLIRTKTTEYKKTGLIGSTYELRVRIITENEPLIFRILFGFEGEFIDDHIMIPDDWLIQAYKVTRNKPGVLCRKYEIMK